jgi:hypothetical protein
VRIAFQSLLSSWALNCLSFSRILKKTKMYTFPTFTTASASTHAAADTVLSTLSAAITTSFVPPPQCMQNLLTMMENKRYQLRLHDPYPVPNITMSLCYPKEFMAYTYQDTSLPSYPAFSPLICPEMYSTVFSTTSGYVACCPRHVSRYLMVTFSVLTHSASGYGLAQNSKAPLDQPASGGTCYTNINSGQTINITAYNSATLLGPKSWLATTSGAQGYAYPIDEFRSSNTTITTSYLAENRTRIYQGNITPTAAKTSTASANPF